MYRGPIWSTLPRGFLPWYGRCARNAVGTASHSEALSREPNTSVSTPPVTRPRRLFSFSEAARNNPRAQLQLDRLDEQISNLVEAIASTQVALADIRRDDGRLRNRSVGRDQLDLALTNDLQREGETIMEPVMNVTRAAMDAIVRGRQDVQLFAQDAERAAGSAGQF